MSRPNTRNKNKRQRPEDSETPSSEILRKIHSTGEITKSDIRQLYLVWKPICQGCRGNSKESPNCFCGLIPPANGTRKTGLWQRMADIILSVGENPCVDLRASIDMPAGLTNLGATCYANSILQCLYMNTSFRFGIFSLEVDLLKQHAVLDQLSRLFAQLHSSKMAFIDSAPFIKTLELDNGVQQDSHEFLTLFLSLLERSLNHSKVAIAKTVVQDLFRGSVLHVTRCSVCGKDSEASSQVEDFYELELNIKGLYTLEESLDDYLSVEELHGENQYFCESCCTRVDATRCIKLCSLPAVLNFQLKRYIFLPKTTTKKKITSAFSFPNRLNMGKRLGNPSECGFMYDLSAILIHKGTSVNSGHYVAHIKDENSGQWWEFDDEHVSKLGSHPFGELSSSSSNKSEQKPQRASTINSISNGTLAADHTFSPRITNEIFSSTDAYMLMYNLINISENDTNDGTCGANSVKTSVKSNSLPLHFFEEIEQLNASYVNACEDYQLRKDRQVAYVTERRQEVKSVLSEAPVQPDDDSYFWISTEWLRQWADNFTPPCLDNSPIQCEHGKVPASKVTSMKRLSSKSWQILLSKVTSHFVINHTKGGSLCPLLSVQQKNDVLVFKSYGLVPNVGFLWDLRITTPAMLVNVKKCIQSRYCSKYGGGPTFSSDDYCIYCLRDKARTVVCADDYRGRKASLKKLAEAAVAGNVPDGISYFVSKTWLVQWLSRKNADIPCDADPGPTASLRCSHGNLVPEQAPGAKRVLVPENLWIFLFETARSTNSDDILTFPSDSRPCEICSQELTEVACMEDGLRAVKLRQRQNHEKLISGKNFSLYPGKKYFLLPSSWLAKWRAYVTATGKNISSSPEPQSLEVTVDSLICQKHLRLVERPFELICKRGVITQKASTTDGLTLISEADWTLFSEEWNVTKGKGISAEIAFIDSSKTDLSGCCKEMSILDEDLNHSVEEATDDLESRRPYVRTYPELCENCIGERASCKLMQKLNYCDEHIRVYFVRGKEAPKSIREASVHISDSDRRTSKRSRKTSFGNSINLKVSGSTSIYQLKLMIWEAFGVVKENQKIHKGSVEIEGDSSTLADKNIFPGDVLWVTDSEIHENRDIADELSEQKINAQHAEEGFRGTLLTSDVSVQNFQDPPPFGY